MFDLSFSEEQIALRKAVKVFGEHRIRVALESGELTPVTAQPLVAELHSMGLLAPVEDGHGVPDALSLFTAVEELSLADPGLGFVLATSASAALAIGALGCREQLRSLLASGVAGSFPRISLQVFEGFGRQPSELATVASRSQAGWVLSGRKIAVHWPSTADLVVVAARDAETSELVLFSFDPQIAVVAVDRDDVEIGRIGLRAADTGTVTYDETLVPASARLTGSGLAAARAVATARLTLAAVALGTARAALTYALQYSLQRTAFGEPIANFQGVTFPLADIEMNLHAVRLGAFEAIHQIDGSEDVLDIERRTSRVVNRALGVAGDSARLAVNTLGGHGYLEDHPCERWYRDAAMLAAIDFDPIDAPLLLA